MLTMEEALKQSSMRFAAGEIVKGTIIEVRPKEVLVDIGYKSEGVISGAEFEDIKAVKVGDVQRMQAWAGQSSRLARVEPAADVVRRLWQGAQELLA